VGSAFIKQLPKASSRYGTHISVSDSRAGVDSLSDFFIRFSAVFGNLSIWLLVPFGNSYLTALLAFCKISRNYKVW
jgi:hypothetical protein